MTTSRTPSYKPTEFLHTGQFLGFFSREIGELWSPWARIGKEKMAYLTSGDHHFFRWNDGGRQLKVNWSPSVFGIGQWGSCGGLNPGKIQTKNRSVCKNAVSGIWGSCRLLLVMGSRNQSIQPVTIVYLGAAAGLVGSSVINRFLPKGATGPFKP